MPRVRLAGAITFISLLVACGGSTTTPPKRAESMLSAFGGNVMDPVVGRRFRRDILSRGGEEPAKHLVERFLGRPVNADALFKEIVGERV